MLERDDGLQFARRRLVLEPLQPLRVGGAVEPSEQRVLAAAALDVAAPARVALRRRGTGEACVWKGGV